MTLRAGFFLFLLSLPLLSMVMAQDRAPHGLANQHPVAFSPSAYDFFHPNARQGGRVTSECSPFPLTAQLQETESQEATATITPEMSLLSKGAQPTTGLIMRVLSITYLLIFKAAFIMKTSASFRKTSGERSSRRITSYHNSVLCFHIATVRSNNTQCGPIETR
ncbi:hypothetical protein Cgig2_028324 [Carnegiea gigantea]|uniref:Secreted protein n=1 Tax=Carnegiea gigantea TaxID=171969 RepID=A0A9Q1QJU9_9CARY|nr:hypothetical protein Cgig2_028324 [Carnegiea gigantea]